MDCFIENLNGQNILIWDTVSDSPVCGGIVVDTKPCVETNTILNQTNNEFEMKNAQFISFDRKYYFHDYSSRYRFVPNLSHTYTQNYIPSDYVMDCWSYDRRTNKNPEHFKDIDVFIENTIYELDEEVKDIVKVLNDMGFRTTGSCSGHNKTNSYIILALRGKEKIDTLRRYINIVNRYITQDTLIIEQDCKEFCDNTEDTLLKLRTDTIGEKSYDTLRRAVEIMRNLI